MRKGVWTIRAISSLLVLCAVAFSFRSASAAEDGGVVSARAVNVRSEPEIRPDNVVGRLTKSQGVEILEERGKWLRVRGRSVTGWVHEDFVERIPAESLQPRPLPDELESYGVALRNGVNVRSRPELHQSTVLFTLRQGQRVEVLRREGFWYLIRTASWSQGWVIAPMISLGDGLVRPDAYLGAAQALVEAGCRRHKDRLEITSPTAIFEGLQLLEKWVETFPESSHTGRAYYHLGVAREAVAVLHNRSRSEDATAYIQANRNHFVEVPAKSEGPSQVARPRPDFLYIGDDFETVLTHFPQSSVSALALLERSLSRRNHACHLNRPSGGSGCDFADSFQAFRDVFSGRATAKGKESLVLILLDDLQTFSRRPFRDDAERDEWSTRAKPALDGFTSVVAGLARIDLKRQSLKEIASTYLRLGLPDDARRVQRMMTPSS